MSGSEDDRDEFEHRSMKQGKILTLLMRVNSAGLVGYDVVYCVFGYNADTRNV